jgi:hypothetical protein
LATDGAQGALRTNKKAFAKLDIIASAVSGVNVEMRRSIAEGQWEFSLDIGQLRGILFSA